MITIWIWITITEIVYPFTPNCTKKTIIDD